MQCQAFIIWLCVFVQVYMWGVCRGQNVFAPMETKFANVDDVFSAFSSPPTMWRTTILGGKME